MKGQTLYANSCAKTVIQMPSWWLGVLLIRATSKMRPRELHISLASNKCCVPRHTTLPIDQRSDKLAMRRPVDRSALRRPVLLPLINIEEPVTVILAD